MNYQHFSPATSEEIAHMKQRVTDILEKKGIKIVHPVVTEILKKAGVKESANGYYRFPAELQEEYLKLAPRNFLIAGIDPRYDVVIPHPQNSFYARGPIGQMFYLDPITGEYRENTMADQLDYIKVQQALDEISLWGNFTVKLDGFPAESMDVHTAALCLKHCSKPSYWMHYNPGSVDSVSYTHLDVYKRQRQI